MATSASSLAATPDTFSGTSTFAGSLQNTINQAVAIASIPLTQLQQNVTDLTNQGNEVVTLQSQFTALQTAIRSLDSATSGNALTATTGDSTIATATVNSSASPTAGSYTVTVTSPGSHSSTLSNTGLTTVADPSTSSISNASNFTLTVGTSTFTVTPTTNTLNALAQSINQSGAPVSATILNLGSPTSPDYRLSLQSTALGSVAIQLNDGTNNLLSTLNDGTPATYQVDGQPSTPISSNSSSVTIAPGVTVDLLKAGTTTINVATDASASENALTSFVTAYNTINNELAINHGTSGGALTGSPLVLQLQQSLRDILNYSGGTGTATGLTSLGITFDATGKLQFDQSQFESVAATNPNDVSAFLGSAAAGTGFLGSATSTLTGLEDPTSGLFETTTTDLQNHITTDNNEIATTQARITSMQNAMVAQMTAADTIIAQLQSQNNYYTLLFADTQNATKNG